MNLSVIDVTELQASIALLFAACILSIIWLVILTHDQRKYKTVLASLVRRMTDMEDLHIPGPSPQRQDPRRQDIGRERQDMGHDGRDGIGRQDVIRHDVSRQGR